MQRDKKIVFDLLDVRFGSLAASQQFITRAAGFGQERPVSMIHLLHRRLALVQKLVDKRLK